MSVHHWSMHHFRNELSTNGLALATITIAIEPRTAYNLQTSFNAVGMADSHKPTHGLRSARRMTVQPTHTYAAHMCNGFESSIRQTLAFVLELGPACMRTALRMLR